MRVTDKVRVLGRGTVLCCEGEMPVMHIDDEVVTDDQTFRIRGIEMMEHDKKHCGLVLSPNDMVDAAFSTGDEITVINKQ